MEFRKLKASEIDCRIAQITEKGLSLLLYKDARVDQYLLDETFGIFGWQRSHELIDGNLYCTVSVRNPETGEWVSKQDVGTESNTEKEKGQASDSFKRACFNWGIGRELYSAPFIWISSDKVKIEKNDKGKFVTYDRFKVIEIGYNDAGSINKLTVISEKSGKEVYRYGVKEDVKETPKEAPNKVIVKTELGAVSMEIPRTPTEEELKSPISKEQEKELMDKIGDDVTILDYLLYCYEVKKLSELSLRGYLQATRHWDLVKGKAHERANKQSASQS